MVFSFLFFVGVLINFDILKSGAVGGFLTCICLSVCQKNYEVPVMRLLAIVSLWGRFAVAFAFNHLFTEFGEDSIDYHQVAMSMKLLLDNGGSFYEIPDYKGLVTEIIAVVYWGAGSNRLMVTFIVSFVAILSGVIVHRTCIIAGMDKKVGYFASLTIWFMPGFVFFTSDLLKDAFVLFCTALTFYLFAVLLYKKVTRVKMLLLIISIMVVTAVNTLLRFYMFVPMLIGIGLGAAIVFLHNKNKKYKVIFAVVFAVLTVLFIVLSQKYVSEWFRTGIDGLFARIHTERENAFAYADAGIKGFDVSTMESALNAMPALIGHYLFQPFPKMWLDTGSALYIKLLVPDMISWYGMMPFLLIGGFATLKSKNWVGIAMIGYLITFLVINAIIVGNVGAIYRYRMQFQLFAFVLAGIGICKVFEKKKRKLSV